MMLRSTDCLYRGWMERRKHEFAVPQDIELFENLPYLEDGLPCHRMDIYRPKGMNALMPVILSLHGGGLVLCDKEVNRPFCIRLAQRGYLVFCIDYPLIPDSDVCGILRDVSAGLDKALDFAAIYGGDPERIFLAGDSAGAFLGIYSVAAQKMPAFAAAAGLTPAKTKISAVGSISGMLYTNLNDSTGIWLRRDFYGKNPQQHPIWPWLSPDRPEIAKHLPPCWMITSKADSLRFQTLRFANGLRNAGVKYELKDCSLHPKLGHDFVVMNPDHPRSVVAIEAMCRFFSTCG